MPTATTRYWLMKTEPAVFSIDDLAKRPDRSEGWNGVRNYEARNLMRDQMKPGDLVVIYHSNATPSGAAGIARVSRQAYPDPDQFDPASEYHDAKATPERPRWFQVDVTFLCKFARLVPLEEIRTEPRLARMVMLHRNRLSITPLTDLEFRVLGEMGNGKT